MGIFSSYPKHAMVFVSEGGHFPIPANKMQGNIIHVAMFSWAHRKPPTSCILYKQTFLSYSKFAAQNTKLFLRHFAQRDTTTHLRKNIGVIGTLNRHDEMMLMLVLARKAPALSNNLQVWL